MSGLFYRCGWRAGSTCLVEKSPDTFFKPDVNASAVGYEAAAALAVSRSTLDRLLNAAVGQSATSAIMQVRLARVKADLVETDLPLKSIARRAGFTSVQHLANLFRSRVGLTPGRYRRDMRH